MGSRPLRRRISGGLTSEATPKAASSSVSRYSRTAREASSSLAVVHSSPETERWPGPFAESEYGEVWYELLRPQRNGSYPTPPRACRESPGLPEQSAGAQNQDFCETYLQ